MGGRAATAMHNAGAWLCLWLCAAGCAGGGPGTPAAADLGEEARAGDVAPADDRTGGPDAAIGDGRANETVPETQDTALADTGPGADGAADAGTGDLARGDADGATPADLPRDLLADDGVARDQPDLPEPPFVPLTDNPFPWSGESTAALCGDRRDNDANGFTDCADFSCARNVAVFVCGAQAVYENSPAACANGVDDDGDRLVDCADPDCFKNPFHDTCAKPRQERGCAYGVDTDGDGHVGCADIDCVYTTADCPVGGRKRVLFDQTLDETAAGGANSDWVVDAWGRFPAPSNPRGPSEWAGALSSFAYDLYATGDYLIESLPSWNGRLSYRDQSNPQDLSLYDVLVVCEPSRRLSAADKSAIIRFVQAGGGLLAVANHDGADRDANGYSAPRAFNDLFDDNPLAADPFGFRFDAIDVEIGTPLTRIPNPTHPVIGGPFGTVSRIGLYQGCTAHLTTGSGGTGLIQLDNASDERSALVAGAVEVGPGRVVFVTDSALAGDGSDSHGTLQPNHDSWHDPALHHRALFLNAVAWLAETR